MQLVLSLAPLSLMVGVIFVVALCVSLSITCCWVLRHPSWLPDRWSYSEDWPRRILVGNLILQPLCLGFILLMLLTFPLVPSLDVLLLTFLSGYGLLAAILGVGLFLGGQIRSFSGWLEKALSVPPQSRARRLATSCLGTFLGFVLVYVTLWLGYPVAFTVLGFFLAFCVGLAIVGISPFYWLTRKWEHQHQQKLLFGHKRRIEAVDWHVD